MKTGLADWEGVRAYFLQRLANDLPSHLPFHGLHRTRDDILPTIEHYITKTQLYPEDALLLRTAALFYNAGYLEKYDDNVAIAVRIANETLPSFGYTSSQIAAIGAMIVAVNPPQNPLTFLAELLCDVDRDYLGREDYFTVSEALRLELMAHGRFYSQAAWREVQIAELSNHRYFTELARQLREYGQRLNLSRLNKKTPPT